jgi:KipI family sensor histidine kinase inhibitor
VSGAVEHVVRLYGDRALLVELGSPTQVVGYVDALRQRGISGVADVVPAAETVLVVAEDGAEPGELRSVLAALSPRSVETSPEVGETLEIPVRYDGADLGDVARLTGLTEQEVVDAHTGSSWRVAFGGFAPGFGYLVGGDPRLQVPRRDAARTAVPAGAVALADEYSGVYPRESPGGWQLIGTTEVTMWDLRRERPALLTPGAVVQFRAVDR